MVLPPASCFLPSEQIWYVVEQGRLTEDANCIWNSNTLVRVQKRENVLADGGKDG